MKNFTLPLTRLFALCIIGFLAGCIPAPMGNYYKPIYPDPSAKYQGDQCYGKAGAPSSLTWTIADGVTLSITTVRTYGEKNRQDRPLRISIGVPFGTQVHFLSDEIRISNSLQEAGKTIPSDIYISAAVRMASNEIADFAKIAPTPFPASESNQKIQNFSAATWLNFSWQDNFFPLAFTMEIPPILLVDSPQVDHHPINLEAKAKKRPERYPGEYKSQTSLIYTTKESESALAEKYAKCLNERPDTQCKNLLIYDEASYQVEKNGFKFSGKWSVYDVEKKTPFTGEIKIDYTKPIRWRFATNKVRIIDAENRTERTYVFDSYPLHFKYQVPISTPIRGVNNPTFTKPTTASIDGSLGTDESPRYFVKMPPVQINGKQYKIQPIELEKRMFDFGLEPFNC